MALTCFPGAVNPFCRQSICVSPCSDQVALASSPCLLYLYSCSNPNFSFTTKFSPHSKALSCMAFHPTLPGLLVTGGAPNSRVNLWSIQGNTVEKRATFHLQRVSQRGRSYSQSERLSELVFVSRDPMQWFGWRMTTWSWVTNMGISIVGINLMKSWANSTIHRYRTNNTTRCNSLPSRTNRNSFSLLRKWACCQSQLNLSSSYKSGTICICHVDLEKNHLNVLHKLLPDSTTTICCSIQFAHADSPLGTSEIPLSPSILQGWFSFARS